MIMIMMTRMIMMMMTKMMLSKNLPGWKILPRWKADTNLSVANTETRSWFPRISKKHYIFLYFVKDSYNFFWRPGWKLQGGFFNWSARFSVPKWKKLAQPTRSFLTLKISWKTSPGWLQLVFPFGTEDRADKLKKTPCRTLILNQHFWFASVTTMCNKLI